MASATALARRPPIDIEFQDLTYYAGRRRIIKGISGHFRPGSLSVIMGPSGAGKSTLMNILVGYVSKGVTGSIKTNGQPRRMKIFKKLSSYIMQEDLLQPLLTVREAMLFSAHLKLGAELSKQQKSAVVDEVLRTLGLSNCADTFTERLSGGQRKRMSVALELVNNPPVIFLDEPTTGLDIVSMNQAVELLKVLSNQGRTVICTIHQPSSTLFNMFDQVYLLASGKCIFQGSSSQLVPFLASSSFFCPPTYNPADYIFEILQPEVVDILSETIQNGKVEKSSSLSESGSLQVLCKSDCQVRMLSELENEFNFPNSFWSQFCILFSRMMLQKRRNKIGLWLQLLHHVVAGVLIGSIFWGVGNNASRPFENFKFCLSVMVFFMYTHCMTPILAYPVIVKIMKREYFNRWYSLKAFYVAQSLSTIPIITSLGFLFTLIVYGMSDQPWEVKRFGWFALNCALMALISEGLGILIGFTFNCTNGAVVGPSTMAPILMLATQGMGYGQSIQPLMLYVMKLSYLRYAVVGIITALYLDNRMMKCDEDEIYCFYRDPRLLVRDLAMEGEKTTEQLYGMFFYLILFRAGAYFSLRYRITTEFTSDIVGYVYKILKRNNHK